MNVVVQRYVQVVSDVAGPPEQTQAQYRPFPSFRTFVPPTFNPSTFDHIVETFESLRSVHDPSVLAEALRRATKWAAVNTGALEGLHEADRGFTFSVAESTSAWEHMYSDVGRAGQQTIADALSSYDFVLDAATGNTPITQAWIRSLHEVACQSQESYKVHTAVGTQEHPLPKGEYKRYPNNPYNYTSGSVHAYAPVEDVSAEMGRLIDELSGEEFVNSHPLLQASYAHYAFVCIHPFADGNGRVARALASVFLYRNPGIPLVIFADQKVAYTDSLEAADRGYSGALVGFVTERSIDVIRMVTESVRLGFNKSLDTSLESLNKALVGRGGLPHEELDSMARRLFDEWVGAIAYELEQLELPPSIELRIEAIHNLSEPRTIANFRPLPLLLIVTGGLDGVAGTAIEYSGIDAARYYSIQIGMTSTDAPDFAIFSGERLIQDASVRELDPTVATPLTYRLRLSARKEIGELVGRLAAQLQSALRAQGYAE